MTYFQVGIEYTTDSFVNLEQCFRAIHESMEHGHNRYYYVQNLPRNVPDGADFLTNADQIDNYVEPNLVEAVKKEPVVTEEQFRESCRVSFDKVDTNQSGEISVSEMNVALKHLGYNLTIEQVMSIIDTFDVDDSGTMGFEEFVLFVKTVNNRNAQEAEELAEENHESQQNDENIGEEDN